MDAWGIAHDVPKYYVMEGTVLNSESRLSSCPKPGSREYVLEFIQARVSATGYRPPGSSSSNRYMLWP